MVSVCIIILGPDGVFHLVSVMAGSVMVGTGHIIAGGALPVTGMVTVTAIITGIITAIIMDTMQAVVQDIMRGISRVSGLLPIMFINNVPMG